MEDIPFTVTVILIIHMSDFNIAQDLHTHIEILKVDELKVNEENIALVKEQLYNFFN